MEMHEVEFPPKLQRTLELWLDCKTDSEIANSLLISLRTLEVYKSKIIGVMLNGMGCTKEDCVLGEFMRRQDQILAQQVRDRMTLTVAAPRIYTDSELVAGLEAIAEHERQVECRPELRAFGAVSGM